MKKETKAKIEALKYAIWICESRKTVLKTESYNAACDEIKIFLEASISRLEEGGEMSCVAYVQ